MLDAPHDRFANLVLADAAPGRAALAGACAGPWQLQPPSGCRAELHAPQLRMAHDLSLSTARGWAPYISSLRSTTSIGTDEPPLSSAPSDFTVRPGGTLRCGAVQTLPFAWPQFGDALAALDFALDKNHPARGPYVGAV